MPRDAASESQVAVAVGDTAVRTFCARVPQTKSNHEAANYQGDKSALASACRGAGQLDPELLSRNYFHNYLQYCADTDDAARREAFMHAKFEPERLHQWAGPSSSTITQVTAATSVMSDTADLFQQALDNIFSVAFKPLDRDAVHRAIKARFKVTRHEVFSQGPNGLFRADDPDTLRMQRYDQGRDLGKQQGRFVWGSIVLVCVHSQLIHTKHAVFSVATPPFKSSATAATPAFMPWRVCVNWAPGVDFAEVEAWWGSLLRLESEAPPVATAAKFRNMDLDDALPFTQGVRLIKACLEHERSNLKDDILDRTVQSMLDEAGCDGTSESGQSDATDDAALAEFED